MAGDLIAAMAGFRPQIMLDASETIPPFDRPVLVIWGDACKYFPVNRARRLASDFPHATLITIPGAKTSVPVDAPSAATAAITDFVPLSAERGATR